MKIGILSDTHGIFREDWICHLSGCDYLIHAGDLNTKNCYDKIKDIGVPLYAVRGNCDMGEFVRDLPSFLQVRIGGKLFFIVHNKSDLPFDLTDADFVIFGHTHAYTCYDRFGKIFINPGSAGQPRGDARSLAILELNGNDYEIQRIFL